MTVSSAASATTIADHTSADHELGFDDRDFDDFDEASEPTTAKRRLGPTLAGRATGDMVGFGIALVLSLFVFALLNWPDPNGWADLTEPLLFLNTTPSGGDMGAHVWGPAFLRDHLLPQGLLSGWTPDWYAGFPAYHFYMVVPSLFIVGINAGLPWYLGVPAAALVLYGGYRFSFQFETARNWVRAFAVVAAVLLLSVPYGVSFKLVSVAGLVMFPIAAYGMGRLARSPEPVPAFLALASFIFLFDTNFTIYGGNIASTLAGEFAFSLSLCLSLVAIGMTIRGMDDHRWRAPAAVVIGLAALCHIIPVFFLVPALLLLILMHPAVPRAWVAAGIVSMALIPIAFADGTGLGVRGLSVVAVLVVLVSAAVAEPVVFSRAIWLAMTGFIAMLLAAFWLLPFYLREPFFNDMGWERLNDIGPPMLTVPIKIALPVAALGLLLSFSLGERMGMVFAGTGLLFAAAVANVGEGPLWNARLLPFYYLSVYMLAAIGIALVVRYIAAAASGELERPDGSTMAIASSVALLAVLVAVSMPLRIMPFGRLSDSGDGTYEWLVFTNRARSFIPGWAEWNYSGYERKPSYAEYNGVVTAMTSVGERQGCGRAMWEYEKGLDRYGTPMALMLLPHWTDGCIGSMEGLYFESSSTTPFHFLNQSTLSEAPSRAQRDLPYQNFDINRGVDQLQVTGVRYYLAQSDVAIAAAREHPDLTEVAEAQPFVIFEVAGSELVESLDMEPVVTSGRTEEEVAGDLGDESTISRFEVGWVSQAVQYYNDPALFPAMPAEDGPDSWLHRAGIEGGAERPVDPVEVSNIDPDTNKISFSVDRVGSPVLVKVSYFPNWAVDGADGPWRIGPNLMVVVPTENDVTLSYGRSSVDLLSIGLTVIGLMGLLALGGIDRRRWLVIEHPDLQQNRSWNDEELQELTGEHHLDLGGDPAGPLPSRHPDRDEPIGDWALGNGDARPPGDPRPQGDPRMFDDPAAQAGTEPVGRQSARFDRPPADDPRAIDPVPSVHPKPEEPVPFDDPVVLDDPVPLNDPAAVDGRAAQAKPGFDDPVPVDQPAPFEEPIQQAPRHLDDPAEDPGRDGR